MTRLPPHHRVATLVNRLKFKAHLNVLSAGSVACSPSAAAHKDLPAYLSSFLDTLLSRDLPASGSTDTDPSVCLVGHKLTKHTRTETHTHSLHMCSVVVCFLNYVSSRCVFALSLQPDAPPHPHLPPVAKHLVQRQFCRI